MDVFTLPTNISAYSHIRNLVHALPFAGFFFLPILLITRPNLWQSYLKNMGKFNTYYVTIFIFMKNLG